MCCFEESARKFKLNQTCFRERDSLKTFLTSSWVYFTKCVHFSQLIFRSLSRIAQSLSEWQHWRHGNKVLYFTRVSRDDKWNSLRHAAPMIMMSPTFHKRQKKTYSEVLSNKSTILLMNFDDMTCTSEIQLRRMLKI